MAIADVEWSRTGLRPESTNRIDRGGDGMGWDGIWDCGEYNERGGIDGNGQSEEEFVQHNPKRRRY